MKNIHFVRKLQAGPPVPQSLQTGPISKRNHDLRFIFSANTVTRVVVFKRTFLSSYTTSLWNRFLRFSLPAHKKLEEDLENLVSRRLSLHTATIGYADRLTFGEIGAKMMATVSNLTGIVDRLEEKIGVAQAGRE